MGIIVGIDLGTTNSIISYWKRGKVNTLSIDGMNVFPSVVTYKDDKILVGYQAKSRLQMDPANTVGSTKRDIGTDTVYYIGGKNITPVDVAYEVLKALKEKTESTLGEKIDKAVITVPAYFKSEQREATLEAARRAGLNVLRLVPEPTAAAIAYGINQNMAQTIMVYDLGGGTFDVSLLKVKGNDFDVIAVDGDSRLGGDDFDDAICNLLYDEVKRATGISLKLRKERLYIIAKQKIKEAAEKAKIELSERDVTDIILPNLFEEYCLEYELTRDVYYKLIKGLLDKTIQKMKDVLKQAKLTADDIDRVILVGGSTKAPIIKELVKKEIREPFIASNVDEVVSNGATILAATLGTPELEKKNNDVPDIFVKEKTVHSYGIDMVNDSKKLYYKVILPRGTSLPAKSGVIGVTNYEYQDQVIINIFRGESSELEQNDKLGGLTLDITNPLAEQIPVGAIFDIDENMIIRFVSVELIRSNLTNKIIENSINNNGILDVQGVEGLISQNKVRYKEIRIDTNTKKVKLDKNK